MNLFSPANILIPKPFLRERFSVVACDQYTSQPEYWDEAAQNVGDAPSALKIIVPESLLESGKVAQRIESVHSEMEKYLKGGIFDEVPESYIYVERMLRSGKVRRGVIGKVDLCAYDYSKRSHSPVRATEATVLERIPPRVAVREGAAVECPHVMLLIDDPDEGIIGDVSRQRARMQKLYDFPLMMDSGSVAGWRVDEETARTFDEALATLEQPEAFTRRYGVQAAPLAFAVGDGNHSLASAKEYYVRLCAKYGEKNMESHPARYALVELVNLHDPSLEFEPVHRVVYSIDRAHFTGKLEDSLRTDLPGKQAFDILKNGERTTMQIGRPVSNMTIGSLQSFIDEYLQEFGGRCDYIHGDDVVSQLSCKPDTLGFMLPPIEKDELFKTVALDGSLIRKTFSMGNACDKRFYLECRAIAPHNS